MPARRETGRPLGGETMRTFRGLHCVANRALNVHHFRSVDLLMNVMSRADSFEGHRVRVMWERPAGIWVHWPLTRLRKATPIYVFVGYVQGSDEPLRICVRDDGSAPFIIADRLAYDGGYFSHGPYANAARYDSENNGHTLSDLFRMLRNWVEQGDDGRDAEEQQALDQALVEFRAWIWREYCRDRAVPVGVRSDS